MVIEKKPILIATVILGAAFVGIGLLLMHLGLSAAYNESLVILEMEKRTSYTLVYTGGFMMLASGIGWTAAA